MTDTTNKLRAVFLTALMLGSVFAAGIAFTGSVAAEAGNNTDSFSLSDGTVSTLSSETTAEVGISTSSKDVIFAADTDDDGAIDEGETFQVVTDGGANDESGSDGVVHYTFTPSEAGITTSGATDILVNGESGGSDEDGTDGDVTYPISSGSVMSATLNVESATESSRSITSSPATAFLGEENVDLSALTSGTSASLVPTGDEGATVVPSNIYAVDFVSSNNIQAGITYEVENSSGVQGTISVVEPSINDVTLYQGPGTDGADVTNSLVADSADRVTVEPEFNFEQADRLEVTVTDSSGLEVTKDALDGVSNTDITTVGGDHYYTGSSDGTFQLNATNLDTEQYNVTVEGDDLDSATHTVSFTIGETDTAISLDQTEVTQGENVIATVTGTPGETLFVQVENDSLASGVSSANTVFANTGDVDARGFNTSTNYAYAQVGLGDDGQAQVRIKTSALEDDATTTVEVSLIAGGSDEDSVDLRVNEPSVSIASSPGTVAVGSDFTLNGTAPEVDYVSAYVKLDNTWYKINTQSGEKNPVQVEDDGTYELELKATGDVLSIPGSYRIGVAAEPGQNTNPDGTYNQTQWGDATTASTTIQTTDGTLSAAFERGYIATNTDDDITLSGTAVGQGDEVIIFGVGPRGSSQNWTATVEDDNTFEKEIGSNFFQNNGQYQFRIIGQGRDSSYATDRNNVSISSATQSQAIEIIEDAYSGAGVDDVIVNANVSGQSAQVAIDQTGDLEQEVVTITGTTNRQPDSVLFVDLVTSNGQSVASTEAEVSSDGTWSAQLDLTQVETGSYTLSVEGDEATASVSVNVVEPSQETTQAPQTTAAPQTTEAPQTTAAPETTEAPQTTEAPATETTSGETGGGIPGFGMGIALIAVLGAALLALRQN